MRCARQNRTRTSLDLLRLESRWLPATINGLVFYDTNGNGVSDSGEAPIGGATVFLDSNNNGTLDNGPTQNFPSTNVPIAISSTGTPTINSTLSVPTVAQIADINVRLTITHTWCSDLTVSLIGPTGVTVTLFSGVGGMFDNFTNTVLDDQAPTSITSGAAPFTGTFSPSPGSLSAFNNLPANGTWTLRVQDTADQDGGSLTAWSLDIVATGEPTAVTPAAGTYSFTSLAAGDYNVVHPLLPGHVRTAPGGDGRYHVTLLDTDTFTGNFGERLPPATISGIVFNDLNSNGTQQGGEPPVPNVAVYLDLNQSGSFTASEPTTMTDSSGAYSFVELIPNLTYIVAEVVPSGFTHVAPIRSGIAATPNINTSKRQGDQAETAIAIDPTNPNRIFTMSNILTGAGMSASFSTDGGATWVNRIMASGSDGLIASAGDPSMAWDRFGNLWISYLAASGISTVVARSTNGGQSFTPFQTAISGSTDHPAIRTGPSNAADRALVVVAARQNGQAVTYLEVNAAGPIGSFSAPVIAPQSNSGIGGNFGDIAIGPNGQVAIAYVNAGSGQGPDNIYFNLDPDGVGPLPFGGRTIASPTNVGGFDSSPAQPSRTIDAEPDLCFDLSGGPRNGRLYLVYNDELVNESNNFEVMLRYSDNNGGLWTSPLRVNDDMTTRAQFLPRMDVDQTTGNIAVSFYDCRNDLGNTLTEYWATASFDGGLSFAPNIKLSAGRSSAVGGSIFDYGDYQSLSFVGGQFIGAWADNSNSTGDNPNGTSNFDIYVAKVTVANNVPNHSVPTMPGQTYSGRDFAINGAVLATIADVQINDDTQQRSRVTSLQVTFDATVTFAGAVADAFTLVRDSGSAAVSFVGTANVVGGVTIVTLDGFSGAATDFGSLGDGRYTFTALANQITSNGQFLDGDNDGVAGGNFIFGDADGLFRFYGDMNADRRVDISDFGFFSLAYLTPANYNAALDFNNDGRIDIADFGQFSVRFFTTLP